MDRARYAPRASNRELALQLRKLAATAGDPYDPAYRRLRYVATRRLRGVSSGQKPKRADDGVLGDIPGDTLKLELSGSITHATSPAKFLGYELVNQQVKDRDPKGRYVKADRATIPAKVIGQHCHAYMQRQVGTPQLMMRFLHRAGIKRSSEESPLRPRQRLFGTAMGHGSRWPRPWRPSTRPQDFEHRLNRHGATPSRTAPPGGTRAGRTAGRSSLYRERNELIPLLIATGREHAPCDLTP